MWIMTRIAAVPVVVLRVAVAVVVAGMLVLALTGGNLEGGRTLAGGLLEDEADRWCVWASTDSAPVVGSVYQEACVPSP